MNHRVPEESLRTLRYALLLCYIVIRILYCGTLLVNTSLSLIIRYESGWTVLSTQLYGVISDVSGRTLLKTLIVCLIHEKLTWTNRSALVSNDIRILWFWARIQASSSGVITKVGCRTHQHTFVGNEISKVGLFASTRAGLSDGRCISACRARSNTQSCGIVCIIRGLTSLCADLPYRIPKIRGGTPSKDTALCCKVEILLKRATRKATF